MQYFSFYEFLSRMRILMDQELEYCHMSYAFLFKQAILQGASTSSGFSRINYQNTTTKYQMYSLGALISPKRAKNEFWRCNHRLLCSRVLIINFIHKIRKNQDIIRRRRTRFGGLSTEKFLFERIKGIRRDYKILNYKANKTALQWFVKLDSFTKS